jgi:hypothetical protein
MNIPATIILTLAFLAMMYMIIEHEVEKRKRKKDEEDNVQ